MPLNPEPTKPRLPAHRRLPVAGPSRPIAVSLGLTLALALGLSLARPVTAADPNPSATQPATQPASSSARSSTASTASTAAAGPAALAVEVVFVLDNSGSMRAHDPGFLTRQAVLDFADALAARGREQGFEPRIGVVLFDEDVTLALPLTPIDADSGRALLGPALAGLDYSGQLTRSADAVERALYALRPTGGAGSARQAIVLLTDGKLDTGDPGRDYDAATWLREDLAGESRERGIRIFGLAFTDRADYQLIQAIARKTDAAYYRAERAEELAPITESVLARLVEVAPPAPIAAAAPVGAAAGTPPDVSAAPVAVPGDTPALERLGWLPMLVLLLAAGGYAGLRARSRGAVRMPASTSFEGPRTDLPPAQLLDVGGVLGETGRAIPLRPGRTRIGRDPNNDIVIADDTISSEHAVIELVGGRYWLEDLRSTNGTKHGDARLARGERVVLKGGDHIRFADVDLMFVFAGYVPGGATVLLPSTSAPPSYWQLSRPGAGERIEAIERAALRMDPPVEAVAFPSGESTAAEASVAEPSAVPASLVDAPALNGPAPDAAGDVPVVADEAPPASADAVPSSIETTATSVEATAPEAPVADRFETIATQPSAFVAAGPSEEATRHEAGEATRPDGGLGGAAEASAGELYRECLDYHLLRVAELSPAFARFVDRAFDDEMRSAMRVAAAELVEDAQRDDRLAKRAYTRDRIRYVLCGAPGGMDVAAEAYRTAHGGFSRFLSEEISSESFREDRCETLAVLTFGCAAALPWVSLSIVPDEGREPRIDLLSYELLSDAERQAIEPQTLREVSQTGRA